jgi:hypothetical protein
MGHREFRKKSAAYDTSAVSWIAADGEFPNSEAKDKIEPRRTRRTRRKQKN